jgi:hypothetical protein
VALVAIVSGDAVIFIVASAPGVVVDVDAAGVEELDLQPETRKQKIAIKQNSRKRIPTSCSESLRATDFSLPHGPDF